MVFQQFFIAGRVRGRPGGRAGGEAQLQITIVSKSEMVFQQFFIAGRDFTKKTFQKVKCFFSENFTSVSLPVNWQNFASLLANLDLEKFRPKFFLKILQVQVCQ